MSLIAKWAEWWRGIRRPVWTLLYCFLCSLGATVLLGLYATPLGRADSLDRVGVIVLAGLPLAAFLTIVNGILMRIYVRSTHMGAFVLAILTGGACGLVATHFLEMLGSEMVRTLKDPIRITLVGSGVAGGVMMIVALKFLLREKSRALKDGPDPVEAGGREV